MNYAQKLLFYLKKNPDKWVKRKTLVEEIGMSEPTWSVLKDAMIDKGYLKMIKKANHTYYKATVKVEQQDIEESLNDLEGLWMIEK